MLFMASKHSTFPPDPPPPDAPSNAKIAHLKGFWELASANTGFRWLKIASDQLFEHPKWSRNNFEKKSFDHFWTHR